MTLCFNCVIIQWLTSTREILCISFIVYSRNLLHFTGYWIQLCCEDAQCRVPENLSWSQSAWRFSCNCMHKRGGQIFCQWWAWNRYSIKITCQSKWNLFVYCVSSIFSITKIWNYLSSPIMLHLSHFPNVRKQCDHCTINPRLWNRVLYCDKNLI